MALGKWRLRLSPPGQGKQCSSTQGPSSSSAADRAAKAAVPCAVAALSPVPRQGVWLCLPGPQELFEGPPASFVRLERPMRAAKPRQGARNITAYLAPRWRAETFPLAAGRLPTRNASGGSGNCGTHAGCKRQCATRWRRRQRRRGRCYPCPCTPPIPAQQQQQPALWRGLSATASAGDASRWGAGYPSCRCISSIPCLMLSMRFLNPAFMCAKLGTAPPRHALLCSTPPRACRHDAGIRLGRPARVPHVPCPPPPRCVPRRTQRAAGARRTRGACSLAACRCGGGLAHAEHGGMREARLG